MNTKSTADFDWRLVRSFLAVLDQGSLLAAARALNVSQPTLGRHITELESQLASVLFERTGRGLVPTRTALQLAEAARQMQNGALQLSRTWPELRHRPAARCASQPVCRWRFNYCHPFAGAAAGAARGRQQQPGQQPAAARGRHCHPHDAAGPDL
ncbi:MAG: LysR family transcriptional regulator, partial [Betaproteobacteria bacterium]|nr:LysR family transcriptional regulator [Betaproteobacteria bacterium]